MTRRCLTGLVAVILSGIAQTASGQPAELLPAEEAFRVAVAREAGGGLAFRWTIVEGHYLYRDRFEASDAETGEALQLRTEPGTMEEGDANFGPSEVYYGEATAQLEPLLPARVTVVSQGCRKNEICYPPVTVTVDTRTLSISEAFTGFDLDAMPDEP